MFYYIVYHLVDTPFKELGMKLYTVQPECIFEQAQKTEFFMDPNKSELLNSGDEWSQDFKDAYNWLVKIMERRIPKPAQAVYPIWAWFKYNGKNKKPDLRTTYFRTYPKGHVLMELEVPDNKVLLTDEESWHGVLNKWVMFDTEDQDVDKNSCSQEEYIEYASKTWHKVFNLSKDEWGSGDFIQATFWSIKPEYIKRYWRFGR